MYARQALCTLALWPIVTKGIRQKARKSERSQRDGETGDLWGGGGMCLDDGSRLQEWSGGATRSAWG